MKEPRTILIDTREQRALPIQEVATRYRMPFATRTATLPVGDYELENLGRLAIVERKGLGDLVACCGVERDRFERMLERLEKETAAPFLVIEGTPEDVLARRYEGALHPSHVLGSVSAWSLDYRLRVAWCGSPRAAAEFVVRLFGAVARRVERGELAAG